MRAIAAISFLAPVLALCLAPTPAVAQLPEALAELPIDDLAGRLEALSPEDPEPYLLLGEEVAAEAQSYEELKLAQRLYVLAFELDRPAGGAIAASAALALADSSRLTRQSEWLAAMAAAIDPRYAQRDWNDVQPVAISPQTALDAATALGLVRSGHGRDARALLDRPEVFSLIRRYESALVSGAVGGAADALRREAERWPCPECGFERISRRIDGQAGYVPCRVCGGNPGPRLSREELIRHLRLESRLLSGIQRSWAAQVATDGGAPLRDPEPEELAPTLGVDPARTIWRAGEWRRPPGNGDPQDEPRPDAPREGDPVTPPEADVTQGASGTVVSD